MKPDAILKVSLQTSEPNCIAAWNSKRITPFQMAATAIDVIESITTTT